jgi:Protein of unknown function (DUF1822)
MSNLSSYIPQTWLNFERLPTTAMNLSTEQIHQAVDISHRSNNESHQWQTYLNALALFCFEEWLTERDDSFTINREKCTIFQPGLTNIINAVSNLQIGEFKFCLITTGSLTDEEVVLSKIVVDLPEFIPHFYVLIEVLEEQENALVVGCLSYQELTEYRINTDFHPDADWNYHLPLTQFRNSPDHLLLYLRCLEPEVISLPEIPGDRSSLISAMQNELATLLPQLQNPEVELSQVLTWEQATAVLTSADILNWIYGEQRSEGVEEQRRSLLDLLKLLTQPALNVGRWLWDELDELAQEFSWVLLPSLAPATAMRSPVEEFEVIVSQLESRGLEIPSQGRGAYQDLLIAGISLRLYAVTWHLVSETDPHLWTLLLVLGTSSLQGLPYNLKLRVSDQTGILVDKGLNPENSDSYLFTRVVGNWDEKFLVTISLMDGVEVNLPPFAFDLAR